MMTGDFVGLGDCERNSKNLPGGLSNRGADSDGCSVDVPGLIEENG